MASISVAISGGGHRASLFGLGALLYLADSGKNREVTSIASVSGGSMTNGFVAQELAFDEVDGETFARAMAPFASLLANRGTFQGVLPTKRDKVLSMFTFPLTAAVWWIPTLSRSARFGIFLGALALWAAVFVARMFGTPLARAYGVALVVTAGAAFVPFWVLPLTPAIESPSARLGLFVVALLAWASLVFGARGRVCGHAFRTLLYSPGGRATRLDAVGRGVDHVLCATEIQSGDHIYFSPRFLYGYSFGRGKPDGVSLADAVQASACLPGAFPPRRMPAAAFRFEPQAAGCPKPSARPKKPPHSIVLTDGGAYDNMGDQWAQGWDARTACWPGLRDETQRPEELIVVNASAGLGFEPVKRSRIPAIGEVAALMKIKSILYDQTTAHRRQGLVGRFDRAILTGDGLRGALVHIPQSPYRVAEKLVTSPIKGRGARARRVLELLDGSQDEWDRIAEDNAAVGTVLGALGEDVSARLIRHGYVLAMTNLHIVLDYPLLELPDMSRVSTLVRG